MLLEEAIALRDPVGARTALSSFRPEGDCRWYSLVSEALIWLQYDLSSPPPAASTDMLTLAEPIVKLPEQHSLSILHMMAMHCSKRSDEAQKEFKQALDACMHDFAEYQPIYNTLVTALNRFGSLDVSDAVR